MLTACFWALDRAIITRLQGGVDRLWDAFGIAIGDLVCGFSVILGASAMRADQGAGNLVIVGVCLLVLTLGWLHAQAQRRGMHDMLNMCAREIRENSLWYRMASLAWLAFYVVGQATGQVGASGMVIGGFGAVMLYAATLIVRPRAPVTKDAAFAARKA